MKSTGIVVPAPDFRTLFEASPDLCVVLSPDLTILAVSDAYLRAPGTVRSEIVGRNLLSVFPPSGNGNGDNNGGLAASLRSVLTSCRPDTMAVQKYSFSSYEKASGVFDERFWSPVNSPVLGPDGNVQWIIHRIEDVTELVRLKQTESDRDRLAGELRDHAERMETEAFRRAHEVAQANRQLQKANKELAELYEKKQALDRLKTGFFASLSGEFQAPLNLILAPVEDARAQDHGTLQGESLREVYVNAMQLLKLVNSLVDFARVGQGVELLLEPTNLPALTSKLAESFRTRVEQAGLEMIVDCPSHPELVFVDQSIWEKIVVNLVSNAFKATFEGSIAVSMEWQSDRVVVLFRDTGMGIPEHELPRIFEPFHRIPGTRSRTHEGTSIGLALVQELVRHHGGSVDVWSEEGRGTTFRVALPLRRRSLETSFPGANERLLPPAYIDPSNLDFETALASSAPHSTVPQMQGHILVVDDDAGTRGYLYRLLSPSFRVSVAENGSAALAAVRKEPPDLILSDVMIPVIDGPGLVRSLREDPQTATIPVILLSNRTGEDGISACVEMVADDYLVGPFSAGRLLARIRVQLQLSRVRRAAADAARDLAKSRAALVQKLEARKRELETFSNSDPGELRAPVQHIAGLLSILEREFGTSVDQKGQHYLSTVASAAREDRKSTRLNSSHSQI